MNLCSSAYGRVSAWQASLFCSFQIHFLCNYKIYFEKCKDNGVKKQLSKLLVSKIKQSIVLVVKRDFRNLVEARQ